MHHPPYERYFSSGLCEIRTIQADLGAFDERSLC